MSALKIIPSAVMQHYELDEQTYLSRCQAGDKARQITCWLARTVTQLSLTAIGRAYGRDHSTVSYAVKQINRLRISDPAIRQEMDTLTARVRELAAGSRDAGATGMMLSGLTGFRPAAPAPGNLSPDDDSGLSAQESRQTATPEYADEIAELAQAWRALSGATYGPGERLARRRLEKATEVLSLHWFAANRATHQTH